MQLCKKSGHKIISREKFVLLVISLEIGKPHFKLWSLSNRSVCCSFLHLFCRRPHRYLTHNVPYV